MSVVAWDGKSLVSDRMFVNGTMKRFANKMFIDPVHGCCMAYVGERERGELLANWFMKSGGTDKDSFPVRKDRDDFTTLIVWYGDKHLELYEDYPQAHIVTGWPFAKGSGEEATMGAMLAGKSAKDAVLIAEKCNIYCGGGIDYFELNSAGKLVDSWGEY